MCGIAGAVRLARSRSVDVDVRSVVAAMSARVAHRGPDDNGLWSSPDGNVCLAHRRLAIVDLSARGHQPMASADGGAWITFNGEIYNFRRLREQLAAQGCAFRTDSDTEVLLAAYETWGLQRALSSVEGMFAFALWDGRSRKLHLARDRAGEKPLFVGVFGGYVYFASELRAFSGVLGAALAPSRPGIGDYLAYGYVGAPETMFDGVIRLPPGSSLSVDPGALHDATLASREVAHAVHRYWSPMSIAVEAARRPAANAERESLDELDGMLRGVISDQLACDVPVGVFLSGGIDSSLVAALARQVTAQPITAYTVAFGQRGFDESAHAAAVAAHLGLRHEVLPLSEAEILAAIPHLAANLDEPTANASYFPLVLMARLARQRVTVVLSGDGGDEAFCGYNRYRQLARLAAMSRCVPRAVLRGGVVASRVLITLASGRSGLRLPTMPQVLPAEALNRAIRFLSADRFEVGYDAVMRLFDDRELASLGVAGGRRLAETADLGDPLLAMMSADFLHYLPDDNLAKVDRAAMSTALEVRLPLLNHRAVEASWRLGRGWWIRHGRAKGALRYLLARYVPERTFKRPKMGFTAPVRTWLAGPLCTWANDIVRSQSLRRWLEIPPGFLDREWRLMLAAPGYNPRRLWALVMLGAWADSIRPR
jgi:asparagine synthase (glutamine-hydrolysing)